MESSRNVMLGLVVLCASCGGGSTVTAPPPPPPPPSPVIALGAGDGQIGPTGAALNQQLQVLVTQGGTALANQLVVWQTSSGSVAPVQSVTTANGQASATWVLGATAGMQTAVAFVGNTSGASITFSALAAVAAPGPAVQIDMYTVGGSRFEPAAVIVPSGTTINWVWKDGAHSVLPYGATSFPSGTSSDTPHTYSFRFTTPGTYRYYCYEHGAPGSGMYGVVVVQ